MRAGRETGVGSEGRTRLEGAAIEVALELRAGRVGLERERCPVRKRGCRSPESLQPYRSRRGELSNFVVRGLRHPCRLPMHYFGAPTLPTRRAVRAGGGAVLLGYLVLFFPGAEPDLPGADESDELGSGA